MALLVIFREVILITSPNRNLSSHSFVKQKIFRERDRIECETLEKLTFDFLHFTKAKKVGQYKGNNARRLYFFAPWARMARNPYHGIYQRRQLSERDLQSRLDMGAPNDYRCKLRILQSTSVELLFTLQTRGCRRAKLNLLSFRNWEFIID